MQKVKYQSVHDRYIPKEQKLYYFIYKIKIEEIVSVRKLLAIYGSTRFIKNTKNVCAFIRSVLFEQNSLWAKNGEQYFYCDDDDQQKRGSNRIYVE